MINIFRSNTSNSATEHLIEELRKNNSPESRHIVFCPSNFGYSLEKLIHETLNIPGSFNIEVTSFSRYSYRYIRSNKKTIGNEGSVLLVKKVSVALKKNLRHYFKVVDNINFASRMYKTLKLMQQNGYNPVLIRTQAEDIKGATGDKLKDIADIMEEFEKEISSKYIDTVARLEIAAKEIEVDTEIKKSHIYFTGFTDFSTQELKIVSSLEKNALSVNIAVVSGAGFPNGMYFPDRMLNQISNLEVEGATIGKEVESSEILKSTADIIHKYIFSYENPGKPMNNSQIRIFKETNVYEEINGVAREIVRLVRREDYRYKDISIVSCSSDYVNEITQIFQRYDIPCFVDIKFSLSQALSASFLLLSTEAAKYFYRRDKVIALMKHPLFIGARLSELSCRQDNECRDDIFKYENYIFKTNIDFNDFTEVDQSEEGIEFEYIRKRVVEIVESFLSIKDSSKVLLAQNVEIERPEEFEKAVSESEIDVISLADCLLEAKYLEKAEINTPQNSSKAKTGVYVSDYVKVCRQLLGESADTLNNIITKRRTENPLANSADKVDEPNVRANKILSELLSIAEEIIGNEKVDIAMFEQYLRTLIEQQSIAMIPRYVDSVFVGDLTNSYVIRPKVVFVIAASSANLLSGKLGQRMLSPKDTQLMESNGLPIYPTERDLVMYERYAFIDLVSKYADKFYIGYAINNLQGEIEKPSEAITEIASILNIGTESLYFDLRLENCKAKEDLENLLCTQENALFTYIASENTLVGVSEADEVGAWLSIAKNSLSEEQKHIIPIKEKTEACLSLDNYARYVFAKEAGDYYISSSAIESFFCCPYSFFLQYGLRLRSREMGTLDPASIGNIIHEVLEKYFSSIAKLNKEYRNLLEKEINDLGDAAIREVFSNYQPLVRFKKDLQSKLKIENLKIECKGIIRELTYNLSRGSYKPIHFEMPFGMAGKKPVIIDLENDKDEKLLIRGKIDRVDISIDEKGQKAKILAIDYKTGGAKDKGNIKNVYMGTEIQPYIYLMALSANFPDVKPAGGLYLQLSESLTREGKSYKFKGQVVTDEDNLKSLDEVACNEVLAEGAKGAKGVKIISPILPFDLKLKGDDIIPHSKLFPISSTDKMLEVMDWVKKLIKTAFCDIDNGCFEKAPLKDCKNCYMREACPGAEEDNYRKSISNTQSIEQLKLK